MQVSSRLRCTLIAQVAVFLQSLVDDPLQFGRHSGIQTQGLDGRRIQDGFENLRGTAAMERERTCRHLVEDSTEREQITARIEFFASSLLR